MRAVRSFNMFLCVSILWTQSIPALAGEGAPAQVPPPAGGSGTVVLDQTCYWRQFIVRGLVRLSGDVLKKAEAPLNEQILKRIETETRTHLREQNIDWSKTDWRDAASVYYGSETSVMGQSHYDDTSSVELVRPVHPPGNWFAPDFDDSGWVRERLRDPEKLRHATYLRASFFVPDPAKASDLKLSLQYRGGARVFLNGQEVARGHLPPGELEPGAKAEDYPLEAYEARLDEVSDPNMGVRMIFELPTFSFDEAPKGQGKFQNFTAWTNLNRKGYERLLKLRNRELPPTAIPARLLKQGSNLLAIELRASHFHPVIFHSKWYPSSKWSHARVLKLELSDPTGTIPHANSRPDGVQVWVEDVHTRCGQTLYNQPGAPVGAIRIVGALNGTFGAQVVVGTSRELSGLKAAAGELKSEGGNSIPASAFSVSFMVPHPLRDLAMLGFDRGLNRSPMNVMAFDAVQQSSMNRAVFSGLAQAALEVRRALFGPESTAVITAEVDKLQYFDHLSATPPARIPAQTAQPLWLSLKVPAGAAPGLYKGSVTIEAAGIDPVVIPVSAEIAGWRVPSPSEFQADVLLEQSPYGIAKHYKIPLWSDAHFTLIESSLRLLARTGNDILYIPILHKSEFGNREDSMVRWIRKKDGALGFDFSRLDRYLDLALKHIGKPRVISFGIMHWQLASAPPTVTIVDEATGKAEAIGVGWREDAFKRIPMWKAFAHSVYEHLKARGLEKSVHWGHAGDHEGDPSLVALLTELFPHTYWTASPHSNTGGRASGGGHRTEIFRVCTEIYGKDYARESAKGWKRADDSYINPLTPRNEANGYMPPFYFRLAPSRALRIGYTGIGRMGFDYFDFAWNDGYIGEDYFPPGIPCNMLAYPGKDAIESSARYETFIEGLQEAEAQIFIEQAIDRKLLPPELEKEAATVLFENFRGAIILDSGSIRGWQDRTRKLYETATRVAQAAGVDVSCTAFKTAVPALGKTTLNIALRNWTGKPRSWKAAAAEKWIVPSRTEGTLAGVENLTVTLDAATLEAGKAVEGTLTIADAAANSSIAVKISATVTRGMELLWDHPFFHVTVKETETREFRVANHTAGEQPWELSCTAPWMKIEPSSGKLPAGASVFVKVTAAPPDAEAATHETPFTFVGAGGAVKEQLPARTFVIPVYVEPGVLPFGVVIALDKMDKKLIKSHKEVSSGRDTPGVFLKRGAGRNAPCIARAYDSMPILIGAKRSEVGLWVFPQHETVFNLEGSKITAFSADVGITAGASQTMIRQHERRANFEIYVDDKLRLQSGLVTTQDERRRLIVDKLDGAKELKLVTRLDTCADNAAFLCVWGDPQFYEKE